MDTGIDTRRGAAVVPVRPARAAGPDATTAARARHCAFFDPGWPDGGHRKLLLYAHAWGDAVPFHNDSRNDSHGTSPPFAVLPPRLYPALRQLYDAGGARRQRAQQRARAMVMAFCGGGPAAERDLDLFAHDHPDAVLVGAGALAAGRAALGYPPLRLE
eukprot:gene36617-34467_t